MKIGIITPAPPGSKYGNRVTALRWARILRKLGHRLTIAQAYEGESFDLLIALHARRSYDSIGRFHCRHPSRPLIVALTGTDLYRDLARSRCTQRSLDLATRIIALQPKAKDELRPELHNRLQVIYQSVSSFPQRRAERPSAGTRTSGGGIFDVCVVGHLRPVKDPFRAAQAARLLPASSRVRVLHVGGAMGNQMAIRARKEMEINARYRWLGEQPAGRVRRIMSDADL